MLGTQRKVATVMAEQDELEMIGAVYSAVPWDT